MMIAEEIFLNLGHIIKSDYQTSSKALKEEFHGKKAVETLIKSTGKLLILHKLDDNKNLFPFFNCSEPSLCKIADYIIFKVHKDKLYVFVCELKTNNPKGAKQQIKATKLFAEYVIKTACRILKLNLEIKPEYRGLIISNYQPKGTTNSKSLYNENNIAYIKSGSELKLDSYCL